MTLLVDGKEVTKVMLGPNVIYEKEKWDEVACLILNFNLKNKDLINAYFEAINQINLYL